jgi:hypothetical protein
VTSDLPLDTRPSTLTPFGFRYRTWDLFRWLLGAPKIPKLELFFPNKRAALAAAFLEQTDLADGHLAVDGFAHVVDC